MTDLRAPCACPTCTAPVADNDDSVALVYSEDDLSVHWLVNYNTDSASWDVAACGLTLDIDSPHLRVTEPVRLTDVCRDCVASFAAFMATHRTAS